MMIERLAAALEGRYRIEGELGEGGMATVYLADDLKHNRKVGLKVLRPELAAVVGAERFLSEIETTANLQHPNILPLFDSGEAGGFLYYVMPYIEGGETLRDKLDRETQLHVDEAVELACEVAEALQAAHERGVIHRDIKPANILLSRGRPLVADFGIALAVSQAGGERLTETGLSLGTPYYMSPEQATGDQIPTAASDVYALGCVLYEALVGEPPYTGTTAQAVLGKILLGTPTRPTDLRTTIPPHVEGAILKALEKLPADRFDSADELARALKDPSFRYGVAAVAGLGRPGPWKAVGAGSGTMALALGATLVWSLTRPEPPGPPVTRTEVAPFAVVEAYPRPIAALTALAPDGSSMVYAVATAGDEWQLAVKRRGSADAEPLSGTEQARTPTYSPDGLEIAWVADAELKRRALDGGTVLTLARDVDTGMPALSWTDDGSILYERNEDNALMSIPAAGGEPRVVRTFGDTLLSWTHPLPGSKAVLVEICPEAGSCAALQQLGVVDLLTGELTPLADEVLRAWWIDSGHVILARRDGTVAARPFDLETLAFTGPAVPLFENVRTGISYPEMAVGADGTVVYIQGTEAPTTTVRNRQIVWLDRSGRARPVDPGMEPGLYQQAVLSPDGSRVAVIVGPAREGSQLWVKELPDGPMTRLTNDPGFTRRPVWTPDGSRIAYVTNDSANLADGYDAFLIDADGSSLEPEVLLDLESPIFEVDFTPDGVGLVFRAGNASAAAVAGDLGHLDLRTDSVDMELLASPYNEFGPAVSPDGRWLAYVSDVSGTNEVFVRPFGSSGGARTQVSTEGGLSPVWSHTGRELFWAVAPGRIMVAEVTAGPSFRVSSRTELFTVAGRIFVPDLNSRLLDLSPDDQDLLMVLYEGAVSEDGPPPARYIRIDNWFSELHGVLGGG